MIHQDPTPFAFSGAHPSMPTTSPSRMTSGFTPSMNGMSVSVTPRHSTVLCPSSRSQDVITPCVNCTPFEGGGVSSAARSLFMRSVMRHLVLKKGFGASHFTPQSLPRGPRSPYIFPRAFGPDDVPQLLPRDRRRGNRFGVGLDNLREADRPCPDGLARKRVSLHGIARDNESRRGPAVPFGLAGNRI